MATAIWPLARALDSVRRQDDAAERSWQERLTHRLDGCRAIIGQLAKGPARFTDIAEPFDLSLNAVTKHLKLLERAGLIDRDVRGRDHFCALKPAGTLMPGAGGSATAVAVGVAEAVAGAAVVEMPDAVADACADA